MTPYFTNKILINDELTLNISSFPSDNHLLDKVFKELIPSDKESLNNFLRYQTLTKREKQILKLLSNGCSNKDVSDQLLITLHSVKTHRKNIYKKLDVNTTTELVRLAIAMELLL